MKATMIKTDGDYIYKGTIKTGKFWKVEIDEIDATWRYPGSFTQKKVKDIVGGNIGYDSKIEVIKTA